MSRSRSKAVILGVGGLVCLLALMELSAYVLTVSSIPARIRGRMGKGTVDFQLNQRLKMLTAQSQAELSVASLGDHFQKENYSGPIMFHGVLGWDYPPNIVYRGPKGELYRHGPDGERQTCTSFLRTEIATYGDSFTHCDEVSDEQTWQTFLGRRIESNVLNYGVGGYGTDQAFLKFQLHGAPRARLVMLCILPENINRVVNIYRPFYHYEDPLALTKPRFVREGSGFRLIANPTPDVGHLFKLEDPKHLAELGAMDYWYHLDQKMPGVGFPFMWSAVAWRKEILNHVALILSPFIPMISEPHYPRNLFDEPEPLAIMCHIVDQFVKNARAEGATPLIAIMPHKDYIREVLAYRVSRIAPFTTYLKEKKYPFVDLVQAMTDLKPSEEQLDSWYQGHATAEGNNVTAELIFVHLRQNGLIAAFQTKK